MHILSTHKSALLTLCMLGNFHAFLSSGDFFQNQLFRKILADISSECQTVSPDLGPNCWHRLSADGKIRH